MESVARAGADRLRTRPRIDGSPAAAIGAGLSAIIGLAIGIFVDHRLG